MGSCAANQANFSPASVPFVEEAVGLEYKAFEALREGHEPLQVYHMKHFKGNMS